MHNIYSCEVTGNVLRKCYMEASFHITTFCNKLPIAAIMQNNKDRTNKEFKGMWNDTRNLQNLLTKKNQQQGVKQKRRFETGVLMIQPTGEKCIQRSPRLPC